MVLALLRRLFPGTIETPATPRAARVYDLRTGRVHAVGRMGSLSSRATDTRIGRGIVRAMDGARRVHRAARRIESAHAGPDGIALHYAPDYRASVVEWSAHPIVVELPGGAR